MAEFAQVRVVEPKAEVAQSPGHHYLKEVERGLGGNGDVAFVVTLLAMPNDLNALVAELPPGEKVIGVDDPVTQPVDFLEDLASGVVLKADLAGRNGLEAEIKVSGPDDAVERL